MGAPERLSASPEHAVEAAGDAAREHQAELLNSPETSTVTTPENASERIDAARSRAHEAAISHERPSHEAAAAPSAHFVRPVNNKAARKKAYKDILHHTQNELPAHSRAFSKVIHQLVIERASGAVGASIARPHAVLFGALFALVISSGTYLIARHYGYPLSGFEAIGSFVLGWAFGMLVDLVRVVIRRR